MVGASVAVGECNVETGSLNDRSGPMDVTNNFNDVAVTGEEGEGNVYITGNSGKMYFSFENGEEGTCRAVTSGAARRSMPLTASAPATATSPGSGHSGTAVFLHATLFLMEGGQPRGTEGNVA